MLAERHKSRDVIGIYDVQDHFKQVRVSVTEYSPLLSVPKHYSQHFDTPTSSLSSFVISPTGGHIAVWESPLEVAYDLISLPVEINSRAV